MKRENSRKLFAIVMVGLLLTVFGEVAFSNEEEWFYAETLPTMKEPYKDIYDCPSADCRLVGIDGVMPVRITNGYENKIERVEMYDFVFCGQGYCNDTEGYEVGVIEHDGRVRGIYPIGYYFVSHASGENFYYRRGTGPYGNDFPPFYIYGEEQATIESSSGSEWESPEGFANNVDLWCDPMTDECRLDGELVLHHELPDHLEMASIDEEQGDSHWCDGPVCYDNTDNFIGLNPYFY